MGSNTVLRRDFLGRLVTGAAAAGIGSLVIPGLARGKTSSQAPALPQSSSNAGFDAWLDKIKGAHKQVYDATEFNHAMMLAWSRVFLMTNASVGVPAGDAMAVVVLRHAAIPLAMETPLWEKYGFGELFGVVDDETKKPHAKNIFYSAPAGTFPLPGMTIEELMKDGTIFGVCDMAMTVFSSQVAKKKGLDAAEVKKEWIAGVMPGITVVPSGVLAVNRAQERGCTYVFAG
jgi:intracellular sulfur oxidation DsrE/DsrF family protein